MLSRVAESMYWMSRYIERAENVARFIDVNQQISLGGGGSVAAQWQPLVHATGDHEYFLSKYGEPTRANVLYFLTFDRDYPHSILGCLESARENGRTIRDNIPLVLWEELNKFFLMVKDGARDEALLDEPHAFYARVRLASHLLLGITDNTMSQGEAWHFGRIGRFVERADKTSRILDVKYFLLAQAPKAAASQQLDFVQWSALLHSVDAFGTYRRQHGRLVSDQVLAFLVLDRLFPRAIHHCVARAEQSLHVVTGTPIGAFSNRAEQRFGRLRSELEFTSIDEVLAKGMHEFIDDLQLKLNAIGDAVHQCFFAVEHVSTAQVQRQEA